MPSRGGQELARACALPLLLAVLAVGQAALAAPRDEEVSGATLRTFIEAEWLQAARAAAAGPVSTRSDAAGACDGVKNGKYAFHTGLEPNPWWQVDLGESLPIARIVVYNRLDYAPGLHNADRLNVLTSDDGKAWTLRHENRQHFGGIGGAKPLEVAFKDGELRARFVRLQVPSPKPVFFHLDEVEVYGPGPNAKNLALHRPADQSSVSQWSTAKAVPVAPGSAYPTDKVIERGRRLAADLARAGLDARPFLAQLDDAQRRLDALAKDAAAEAKLALYLDTCWTVRRLAFANPLLNFDRLLFVKRFTQETYPDVCLNHMPWVSRPGGDICILSPGKGARGLFSALAEPVPERPAASLRYVLNGALGPGHVHGMDLWFDGDRVVFGYARARSDQPPPGWTNRAANYHLRRTEEPTHIFEVGIDGSGLRQLTSGEWSDLDPTYAPNGDVVFASERCGTSLQCNEYDKDETSCNLYVVKPDGSGVRRMSVNKDGDYLPHCLDNGLIGYTRWEYHERSFAYIQSLWYIRPDGTGADALFKQHIPNPWAMEDVRSIPGSTKLVAIATGHHTLAVGPVIVVNQSRGINEPAGIGIVTPNIKPPEGGMDGVPVPEGGVADADGFYSTPWALSEKYFLVSYTHGTSTTNATGYALFLIDVFGNKELIYRDPAISCFIPIPLRPRQRPPVLAEAIDLKADRASCVVSDVALGVEGIAPERIRYIRIAEPIGWPYDNTHGGHRYVEDHNCLKPTGEKQLVLNWTPVRILGDVPVEPDGSAHFSVPPDTAVYFQLLDEHRMELRRMRSFISFQPGERRACVGCHETRPLAPPPKADPLAARRDPSPLIPPPWGDRPISFLRDVQPVLDKHCVACHSGLKPAGKLDFFGGLTTYDAAVPGYGYNRAYATILGNGLVSCSPARAQDASITPPLAYGSHRSKLIAVLGKAPHTERAKLSADDRLRLTMWIDANAPYHDRFVNKRPPAPAYDLASDTELRKDLAALHEKRCTPCHKPAEVTRLDWVDIRAPERSLFLLAPLPKGAAVGSAGFSPHLGKCGKPVYPDATDADYQAVLKLVRAAVERVWSRPRRDLIALKPAGPPSGP